MRKLYNEFFNVSKHGKISEKAMLTRVVTTITVVVMCLIAMSVTAYAYFSYNITSDSHVIKAAHFETDITVRYTDSVTGSVVEQKPITSNYQNHRIALEAGKTYEIEINRTARTTAKTGFVVISANGCADTYHTQQLGVDTGAPGGETETIIFKLAVTASTEVYFKAHWGTSSYYDEYKLNGSADELYITQDKAITMTIPGGPSTIGENGDENNTTTTTTESAATTTTTTEKPAEQTTTTTTAPATTTTAPPTTTSEQAKVTETTTTVSTTTAPTENAKLAENTATQAENP